MKVVFRHKSLGLYRPTIHVITVTLFTFFKSKKRDFTFFLLYFTRTIDSDEQHDTKLPLGEHAKAHPPVELCGLC